MTISVKLLYTGHTLRRGGMAVGMMIGDFFGVTEESQSSSSAWNEVGQRRAEVSHAHNI